MSIQSSLIEIVQKLPLPLQKEVEDFAKTLVTKVAQENGGKLKQDWAGALSEYRDRYTSLELQKKSLEWRGH